MNTPSPAGTGPLNPTAQNMRAVMAKRGRPEMIDTSQMIECTVELPSEAPKESGAEEKNESDSVTFWHYPNASASEGRQIGNLLDPVKMTGGTDMILECFMLCVRNSDGTRMYSDAERGMILQQWNWADIQLCVDAMGILERLNQHRVIQLKKI